MSLKVRETNRRMCVKACWSDVSWQAAGLMSGRRGRGVDTDHVLATGKHFLSQAGCAQRQTAIWPALQAPMGVLDPTTQNILTCLLLQAPTAQGIILSSLRLANLSHSLVSWAARENRMQVMLKSC